MKANTLWSISVTTSAEAEEAVAALLEDLYGQPASVHSTPEAKFSVVTIYSSQASERTSIRRKALSDGLRHIADCGLNVHPARIDIARVKREDWSESWKKHFKTIEIGKALIIKPSWSKRKPAPGQASVTLDPGLSFGTGQHPTTSFCLEQLVACRLPGQKQSFLDIGTGSGILAIAAVKLGYAPVKGFDFDPIAVRVAKKNAAQNRVQDRLSLTRKDLLSIPEESSTLFDVVAANLVDDLLIGQIARIRNRIKPGGKLVLAGILHRQFPGVQRTYEAHGFKLLKAKTEGEWRSGIFQAPG